MVLEDNPIIQFVERGGIFTSRRGRRLVAETSQEVLDEASADLEVQKAMNDALWRKRVRDGTIFREKLLHAMSTEY